MNDPLEPIVDPFRSVSGRARRAISEYATVVDAIVHV